MSFDSTFSESEYDFCLERADSIPLAFDPTSLENVILSISDQFDIRVVLNDKRAKNAMLMTNGLKLAGNLIGRHYGGMLGAAVGGTVGGVCGLGLAVVSMRDIWGDVKPKLSEVFEIVYDYLAGLGLDDYKKAAKFLMQHKNDSTELAMVITQIASRVLGNKILSSLTPT